jgi:hypothetical protein
VGLVATDDKIRVLTLVGVSFGIYSIEELKESKHPLVVVLLK